MKKHPETYHGMYRMTDLYPELKKFLKDVGSKNDCFVALIHDKEKIYMNVMFVTEMRYERNIPIGTFGESKYTTMDSVCRWFRNR